MIYSSSVITTHLRSLLRRFGAFKYELITTSYYYRHYLVQKRHERCHVTSGRRLGLSEEARETPWRTDGRIRVSILFPFHPATFDPLVVSYHYIIIIIFLFFYFFILLSFILILIVYYIPRSLRWPWVTSGFLFSRAHQPVASPRMWGFSFNFVLS